MAKLTATDIRKLFHLEPHPIEGGYFVRTYVSQRYLPVSVLPQEYPSARPVGTAIYYLLTPTPFPTCIACRATKYSISTSGDPVEMLQLRPDGTTARTLLGQDLAAGMQPQHVIVVAYGKARDCSPAANTLCWAPPWLPDLTTPTTRPARAIDSSRNTLPKRSASSRSRALEHLARALEFAAYFFDNSRLRASIRLRRFLREIPWPRHRGKCRITIQISPENIFTPLPCC